MKKSYKGNLLLLITALIWGFAFVAQKEGSSIGAFTFNFSRNVIAGVFLLVVIQLIPKVTGKKKRTMTKKDKSVLLKGGIACGVVLFVAMGLQQIGVTHTTAGKSGFITALYIVIVPLLGIFIGKKVTFRMWVCVVLGAVGLYLLSINPGAGLHINRGDFFVLLCAFAYALHILVIDYFSPKTDGVKMSCIQFFVSALLSGIVMVLFENFAWSDIKEVFIPVLYAGVMSSGVGYTLQIIAQRDTNPTIASLIMSLESVFAVLGGTWLLGERLTTRELLGCLIMFAAIIISQLPEKRWKTED